MTTENLLRIFIATLSRVAPNRKQSNRRMDKQLWYICTKGYHSTLKERKLMHTVTWMYIRNVE